MKRGKPTKRLDLQGIRGLAIIVVLGFHFYPNIFPNGYLGVDQFFVLSGFLMCMLLKRGGGGGDNMQSCSLITLFYSKRFKRILPLYLLIILLSLISLYTIFPDTSININKKSANRALIFMSNRPTTVEEDYFKTLSIGLDIFTHTWSLSVEVQFYLFVPFIYLFSSRYHIINQLLIYLFLAFLSFIFCSFSQEVSFNNVFARTWQFMIGMISYMITVCREDRRLIEYDLVHKHVSVLPKYILLFSVIAILIFPFSILATLSRPFITISTGILMIITNDNDYLLSNRILTYIGDISYSLYLIHWPIYAYWKLTMKQDQGTLLLYLFLSILLAIGVHEAYEKWYLHLSTSKIHTLVISLFIINFVMINKDELSDIKQIANRISFRTKIDRLDGDIGVITLEEADELNKKWIADDIKNLGMDSCDTMEVKKTPLGWCNHTGLDPNAPYKVAILGNSWAANHAKLIMKECHDKMNYVLQGSFCVCESIIVSREKCDNCAARMGQVKRKMTSDTFDYTFLINRFMTTGVEIEKPIEEDEVFIEMMENLNMILKSTRRKVFILDVIPAVNAEMLAQGHIIKGMQNGTTMEVLDKTLVLLNDKYESARRRYSKLFEKCGDRCERIDIVSSFYNKSTSRFRYFNEDNGLYYFSWAMHLTPHGLEHIRHVYTDICNKL